MSFYAPLSSSMFTSDWWTAVRVTAAATVFAVIAAVGAAILAFKIGREAAKIATEQRNITAQQTTIAEDQKEIAASQARTVDLQRDVAGLDVLLGSYRRFLDDAELRKARHNFAKAYVDDHKIEPKAANDLLNCFEEVALYVDKNIVAPDIVWQMLPDVQPYWIASAPYVDQQRRLIGDDFRWDLTESLVASLNEVSVEKGDTLWLNPTPVTLTLYFQDEMKGCAPTEQ
jgi:hypothetical protein